MIVSSLSRLPGQPKLFETPLTLAACRNYTGEFFEDCTVALFGGRRLRTDSRCDVCPDIEIRPVRLPVRVPNPRFGEPFQLSYEIQIVEAPHYLEVKSIGRSGAAMVYEARLAKDLEWTKTGHKLDYVLWRHNFNVQDGMTIEELRNGLATSIQYVVTVPLLKFASIMTAGKLMTLNAKNAARGYGSHGYTKGYRTPLKVFIDGVTPGVASFSVDVSRQYQRAVITEIYRVPE